MFISKWRLKTDFVPQNVIRELDVATSYSAQEISSNIAKVFSYLESKVPELIQSGQPTSAVSLCDAALLYVSSAAHRPPVELWGPTMLKLMECLGRYGLHEVMLRLHRRCAVFSSHSPDEWRLNLLYWTVRHANSLAKKVPFHFATVLHKDLHPLQLKHGVPAAENASGATAVELTRQLRTLYPHEYDNDIAILLHSYARALGHLGLFTAAHNAYTEAVELTRGLYRRHPNQYHDALALRLWEYGCSLHMHGAFMTASIVQAEAVEFTRSLRLLRTNQDHARYQNDSPPLLWCLSSRMQHVWSRLHCEGRSCKSHA